MGSLLKRSLVTALLVLISVLDAPAVPLSPGIWTVLDQPMAEGDFFTGGPWTFTNTVPVVFRITDLFVVSDRYEVYDNGVLVLTTPLVGDWNTFPGANPFTSPPFTGDPDTAFGSGFFSRGTILFQPGSHSITIRDIHLPPTELGPPFPDGTVAFQISAEGIPTLSEWGMIGMGVFLAGAGIWALRRRLGVGTTPRAA